MKSIGIYESKINKPGKTSRTTVPIPVVQALGLVNKDKIVWEIFVGENKDISATVRKGTLQDGAIAGAMMGTRKGATDIPKKGARKP